MLSHMKETTCKCGCEQIVSGSTRNGPRRFISGHNLRNLKRTKAHRDAISASQKLAWKTNRQRLPIGTKRVNAQGYVVVKVLAGKGPWKLEHAIVAEIKIGRQLKAGEIVHHINGDRSDNRPDNLFVCRNRSHHNEVHRSEAAAMRALLDRGLVVFREGCYEAVLPR